MASSPLIQKDCWLDLAAVVVVGSRDPKNNHWTLLGAAAAAAAAVVASAAAAVDAGDLSCTTVDALEKHQEQHHWQVVD